MEADAGIYETQRGAAYIHASGEHSAAEREAEAGSHVGEARPRSCVLLLVVWQLAGRGDEAKGFRGGGGDPQEWEGQGDGSRIDARRKASRMVPGLAAAPTSAASPSPQLPSSSTVERSKRRTRPEGHAGAAAIPTARVILIRSRCEGRDAGAKRPRTRPSARSGKAAASCRAAGAAARGCGWNPVALPRGIHSVSLATGGVLERACPLIRRWLACGRLTQRYACRTRRAQRRGERRGQVNGRRQ